MRDMRGHHHVFYEFLERQNGTRRQCWEQWLLTRDYAQPMPAFPPSLTREEMFTAYQQHYMSRMPFRPRGNTLPSSLNFPTTFRTRNAASLSETRESQPYIHTARIPASLTSGASGSKSFLPQISEEQKENRYIVLQEPDLAREATLAAFLPDKKEEELRNHHENEEIITLTEVIEDNGHTGNQQDITRNVLDQVNNTDVYNNYQTPERDNMKETEKEILKAVQGPRTRRSTSRLRGLEQMRNRLSVDSINSIQMQKSMNNVGETLPLHRDIFGGSSNGSLMPRRKRRTTSIAVNHDDPIIIEDDNPQNGPSESEEPFEIVDQLEDAKQDVSSKENAKRKEDNTENVPLPKTTEKADSVPATPIQSVAANNQPTRTSVDVRTIPSVSRPTVSIIGMTPLSPVGSLPMPEFQVSQHVTAVARTPSRTRVHSLSSYRSGHASQQSSNPPSLPISSLNSYMSPMPVTSNQAPFIPSRSFPGIIDSEPALPDEIYDILEDLRINPPTFDNIYTDHLDMSSLENLEAAIDKEDLLFFNNVKKPQATQIPTKEMPIVPSQPTMKQSVDPAKNSLPSNASNAGNDPFINLTLDKPPVAPAGPSMPQQSEPRLPRQSAPTPLRVIDVEQVPLTVTPPNPKSPIETMKDVLQKMLPGIDLEPFDQVIVTTKPQAWTEINRVVQVKENGDQVLLEEIMPSNVTTLTVEAPAVKEVSRPPVNNDEEGKKEIEERNKVAEEKPLMEKPKVENEEQYDQENDVKEGVRFYSPPAFRTRAQSFSRRSLEDQRSMRRFKRAAKIHKENAKEFTAQTPKKNPQKESPAKSEKDSKNKADDSLEDCSPTKVDDSDLSKAQEPAEDLDIPTDKDAKDDDSKDAGMALDKAKEKKSEKEEAKPLDNGKAIPNDRSEASVAKTSSDKQPKISDFIKKPKTVDPTMDDESTHQRDGKGRFLSFAAMGFKPIEKGPASKKESDKTPQIKKAEKPEEKPTNDSEKKASSISKQEAPKEEKVEEVMPRRSSRIKDINAPQKKKTKKFIKIENVNEEVEKLKRKMKERTPEKVEKMKLRNTKEQAETIQLVKSPRQKRKKLEDIEVKSLSPASSEDEKERSVEVSEPKVQAKEEAKEETKKAAKEEDKVEAKVVVALEPRKLRRTKERVKSMQAQKARERNEAGQGKRKRQVEDKQWHIQCSVCRQKFIGFKNHQHWSPECR